ncbi:hybrid-cluster NAD(P)-dependent oxidoreductase [Arthrobacter sp. MYb227]|uniref:flavin reductase family protein n=1 Tax=Arthrobacter sp. MYb227 TaxID=1848601 RepID=UPI000CFB1415|nr:iron-sulfur cluster-binding domain-containing protein [Arthrobacter sp. MYb227]PQZ92315.1 hybrid-cluster NAD(P)-dependent oxidoreductase [Arthrobacter sp. MYb227]
MTQELHAPQAPLPSAPADRVLRCTSIREETASVKTFAFEPVSGEGFGWLPGQYLTFTLPLPSGDVHRCYSISSIPGEGIEITVKALVGGPGSGWLHGELEPGTVLEAHGPLGSFTPETEAPYLLLAAGSGITPLMSIARHLLQSGQSVDAVLLYSAHEPAEVIFHRELRSIPEASGLRTETILGTGSIPTLGTPRAPGRLDAALLRELVPDAHLREVYACGPAGYLDSVRGMLEAVGHDPARFHTESFDIAAHAPPAPAVAPAAGSQVFSVEFTRSGRTIDCAADAFILDAALAAGIPLPSSCTQGMCGTCKCPLLEGEVEMNHAGGIRPKEIAACKILICCSTPTGNLVIDA